MKELCKHYNVTNNFHSMVTLRNLIQSGDIYAIIVRQINHSTKTAIWGFGDEDLLVTQPFVQDCCETFWAFLLCFLQSKLNWVFRTGNGEVIFY